MLQQNTLLKKISRQQSVFGLFCSIPSPSAVEIIGEAGFDFVIIDTEHVMINPETLENMIRAAEALGLTALVRVSDLNPKQMLKILDAGAHGLVLPMIEHAEQVQQAIAACKYYPEGKRSLNAGRPGAFGRSYAFGERGLVDYMAFANQQIMIIPMIESQLGVANAQEIVSVNGVSFVLEGAADLSQSLGMPWQIENGAVQDALLHVVDTCKTLKVPYAAIPRQVSEQQYWKDLGIKIFVLGDERGIAFRALSSRLIQAQTELSIELPA
jgi:4-hydroxy-2-oxoheptanedioate aldolase